MQIFQHNATLFVTHKWVLAAHPFSPQELRNHYTIWLCTSKLVCKLLLKINIHFHLSTMLTGKYNSNAETEEVFNNYIWITLFISGISQSYVECICPTGYIGTGVGPAGCLPASGGSGGTGGGSVNPCNHFLCVNGNCIVGSTGTPVCVCHPGYTGTSISGSQCEYVSTIFFIFCSELYDLVVGTSALYS